MTFMSQVIASITADKELVLLEQSYSLIFHLPSEV
jgi:hypothetical protein